MKTIVFVSWILRALMGMLVTCGFALAELPSDAYPAGSQVLRNPYTYCVIIDDRHRTLYQSSIFLRRSLSTVVADSFSIATAKRFPVIIGTGKCFEAKDVISAQREQAAFRSQWQYLYRTVDTGWNPDLTGTIPMLSVPETLR